MGNFRTIRDLLKDYSGEIIRYFVISSHYRKPIDFSKQAMDSAKNSYERLKNICTEIQDDGKLNKEYLKEFENAIEFFLKVDFIGKWENIIKFIYDIENSEEPVSIVELRMQNQIKFEDNIKGSLLLSRYYIKDKK